MSETETTETRKRRSHWQASAAKRYPRMLYLGGDSTDPLGAYIAMTKCPHPQTRAWRYVLRTTENEARAVLDRWQKEKCSDLCLGPGNHTMWRVKD